MPVLALVAYTLGSNPSHEASKSQSATNHHFVRPAGPKAVPDFRRDRLRAGGRVMQFL
jgi:hypothetical protein